MFKYLLILIIKGSALAYPDQPVETTTLLNDYQEISVTIQTFDKGIKVKCFNSVLVDNDNIKWFLTEDGIVSFDGDKWLFHNKNKKIPKKDIQDIVLDNSPSGGGIWFASAGGAALASLPLNSKSAATLYNTGNAPLLSNNILAVATGKSPIRWFGTDKGISAFGNDKWLKNSYQRKYRERMFAEFPITSMATTPHGDSLYVGTDGAGVARVYRDNIDAVSGASEYAQWGPIDIPSDNVYSICITPDGTQWFGTDRGVARHIGQRTLSNWTVFNTGNGLVNDYVQAIAFDENGILWFGTKGGLCSFDGKVWKSYTANEGLSSNNILCVAIDKNNIVWCGTDNGVISFNNGLFTIYK